MCLKVCEVAGGKCVCGGGGGRGGGGVINFFVTYLEGGGVDKIW